MNGKISAKAVTLLIAVLLVITVTCAVTAYAAAPDAPAMVTAWASGSGQATVIFNPPAYDGGSSITGYTVTSNPDGFTISGTGSPITLTGLTYNTHYTFTVTATSTGGTSSPSGASNIVIPRPFSPSIGTINNIVVFIRFSDQPEFTLPMTYYDNQFNSAADSLKNFYLQNSYNTLTVNSFLYPESADTVAAYADAHPASYYEPYNASTNPGGYLGGQQGTDRATALITNALNSISAQIPNDLELDGDHDGYVDHITFMVYSSVAHPQPLMFYSKSTFDTSGTVTLKGISVGSYTWVTASEEDPGMYPGATAIHEMGHSFGYPDVRANSGRTPVGMYDVMASFAPTHSGAYMKHRFTKWIPEIPEITSYGAYSIKDITQATNNSYKIKIPGSTNEYLILEYRKAAGPFESYLSSSGLCITRVNEAAGIWGNLGGPPFHLYYFRVDGTLSNDGVGANFVCFSAEAGRTQLNDHSNPACFLSDGSPCGIALANIGSASGSTISFSFVDPSSVTITRNISGSVKFPNGSRVLGATVTLSGDTTGVTTTDNSGQYSFTVNDGGTYTITPSKTNLTISPVSQTFINVTSDKTQNFTATTNTVTISGIVTASGTPLSGATVTCTTGYCPPAVTTDATGTYSFTVDAGGNYDISASKANYFFTPYKKTYTNLTTNQVQNFSMNTATLTLAGTIRNNGSPVSGISVSCPGANTATPTTTNGSGYYSFTVTVGNGSTYTITPSSSSYTFTPASRFYTGLVSNKFSEDYTATAVLVNGACGSSDGQTLTSAPSTNLCAAGTPSSVSGAGPWSWTCGGQNGGSDVSCSASIQTYLLTANAAGTGSGSISANVGGISYTYPTNSTGSSTRNYGTSATLTATADSGSTAAWSGSCSSTGGTTTSATCILNSMDSAKTVTATFSVSCIDRLVAIGGNAPYYSKIQTAYNTASTGDVIELQSSDFNEHLELRNDTRIKLSGGFGCDFSTISGFTIVHGDISIKNGTLIAERLIIK